MHEGPFETQNVTGKPQTSAYMTPAWSLYFSLSNIKARLALCILRLEYQCHNQNLWHLSQIA